MQHSETHLLDEHGHWDRFAEKHKGKLRLNVLKEVEKFRECENIANGSMLLVYEGCHDLRLVPYRCKGRFFGDIDLKRAARLHFKI
nr:transposase zinc-binding domain-containing protein [Paenibacillus agaridevorans]